MFGKRKLATHACDDFRPQFWNKSVCSHCLLPVERHSDAARNKKHASIVSSVLKQNAEHSQADSDSSSEPEPTLHFTGFGRDRSQVHETENVLATLAAHHSWASEHGVHVEGLHKEPAIDISSALKSRVSPKLARAAERYLRSAAASAGTSGASASRKTPSKTIAPSKLLPSKELKPHAIDTATNVPSEAPMLPVEAPVPTTTMEPKKHDATDSTESHKTEESKKMARVPSLQILPCSKKHSDSDSSSSKPRPETPRRSNSITPPESSDDLTRSKSISSIETSDSKMHPSRSVSFVSPEGTKKRSSKQADSDNESTTKKKVASHKPASSPTSPTEPRVKGAKPTSSTAEKRKHLKRSVSVAVIELPAELERRKHAESAPSSPKDEESLLMSPPADDRVKTENKRSKRAKQRASMSVAPELAAKLQELQMAGADADAALENVERERKKKRAPVVPIPPLATTPPIMSPPSIKASGEKQTFKRNRNKPMSPAPDALSPTSPRSITSPGLSPRSNKIIQIADYENDEDLPDKPVRVHLTSKLFATRRIMPLPQFDSVASILDSVDTIWEKLEEESDYPWS